MSELFVLYSQMLDSCFQKKKQKQKTSLCLHETPVSPGCWEEQALAYLRQQ